MKLKKLFAAVAGVVVGAGAVIAGAVALADKKNQDKVSKIIKKAASSEKVCQHSQQTS